jgi:hypothetical protein
MQKQCYTVSFGQDFGDIQPSPWCTGGWNQYAHHSIIEIVDSLTGASPIVAYRHRECVPGNSSYLKSQRPTFIAAYRCFS